MKLFFVVFLACLNLSQTLSVLPEVEYEEFVIEFSQNEDFDTLVEGCALQAGHKPGFWNIWEIIRRLHRLS